MKTRYLSMIAASAAIILASSCTSDQVEKPQADNMEIRVRTDVGNMTPTRAATNIHKSHFDFVAGEGDDPDQVEKIHVEILDAQVDQNGEPNVLATPPVRLPYTFATTTASGSMEPVSTPPYFPSSGNKVNIYGYYPETVGTVGSLVTCVLPAEFAVQTDQSTAAGYKASDLMYGVPAENPVARTADAIPLTFSHKLAKVIVRIKGDGAGLATSSLANATVSMKAMKSASVDNTCTATPATWASATAASISMGTGTATTISSVDYYETAAIVVPQTIAASSANVLTITLADGAVYNYTPENALTLEAGKEHIFTFTLGLHGISVSASVGTWGNGGTTAIGSQKI